MILDALSILLSGIGLTQSAGSRRAQDEILKSLEQIKGHLRATPTQGEPTGQFVPSSLWRRWTDSIRSNTIIIVTGCHKYSEVFDRPTAYALKFAVDQIGEEYHHRPLHAMVMGDYWFEKDPEFSRRRAVISIGGPAVNNISAEIDKKGTEVFGAASLKIQKYRNRYAVHGNDPVDTLEAMNVFAQKHLRQYLREIWKRE